ncbi:MAG: hypothetical protein WDO73_34345 [Ignavibacteriota bacterium]
MTDPNGIGFAVGLQEGAGEEGFVVFDADLRKEDQPRQKKEETSKYGRGTVEQFKDR